jgi:uncharacterized membrane protein
MRLDSRWNELLADDYCNLRFHITYWEALGRRLRRNYAWIFVTHLATYAGKIIVHPTALASLHELLVRAAIGPLPGSAALAFGLLFHSAWIAIAVLTLRTQKAVGLPHKRRGADPLMAVAESGI